MKAAPPLDQLVGARLERAQIAHLPSLRNQWGQGHVNDDLCSLSWVAIPPFSGGYRTGTLRVGGGVPAAESLRWSPWGVERWGSGAGLQIETDVRLGYEQATALWRIVLRNDSDEVIETVVEQELLAPFAHSSVDWGWTYGLPWNAGHHHDFYAIERLRSHVLHPEQQQVQLLPTDQRSIRLGSPRIPGIQRDEDSTTMLLETELPDHSPSDSGRTRAPSALAELAHITLTDSRGSITAVAGEHRLDSAGFELRLEQVALSEGATLQFAVRAASGQTGVLLTHGNHPDSLQIGLEGGRPTLRIGGEHVVAEESIGSGWTTVGARVSVAGADLLVDGAVVASTASWWGGQRWTASIVHGGVAIADSASSARSHFGFSVEPDSIATEGMRGLAAWSIRLAPGESTALGVTLAIGESAGAVAREAIALADRFDAAFAEVADRWRATWTAAFTPGNTEFSGHLPTLDTGNAGLERTYYLGALLAIYMRNTGVSEIGPVFLTGGPRLGPTTTYYWDQSEWARTGAMLEPEGIRSWILAALAQPYDASHSFDTHRLLPTGNHYASNDHALFRIIEGYIGVTGDLAVLEERAGEHSVLDHLRRLAYRPRVQHARFGGQVLVDLGRDPWELLECVPNYRDAVVSFNAGYVGMLRSLTVLLTRLGHREEAALASADASRLAEAVLAQYVPGGRWAISHPEGNETIGHCLDFEFVAAEMAEDLTPTQRLEMVQFVEDHLIDGNWMRALSPDDPIAPQSDRPDHGAAGAFAAWPGATSYGLCRLGREDLAIDFLSRVHASTSGAVWGQAMEAVGDGQFRVAERGVSNRESNAAVAVTEAVIAGIFGIEAGFAQLDEPEGSRTSVVGSLHNVRVRGFDL